MTTPSLSSKEKLARLRQELQASNERSKQVYLCDLDDCAVKWQGGRYRCKAVGCPRCTRRIIGQQQRQARGFFADLGNPSNTDMALLTVVGNGSRDLDEVAHTIEAMDKASRYRVGACRSLSRWWNDFAAWGYFEVDAVGAEHFPLLGSERRAMLAEIAPISMGQNGPTWVPSFHAIVRIGHIGIIEVQEAFARTWSVPGQVHVEPFETCRDVNANIDRLVAYALKNSFEITLPTQLPNGQKNKVQEPWPVSWQADYCTWLHQRRNGFEFLRFSIQTSSSTKISRIVVEDIKDNYRYHLEPMPILF